MPHPEYGGMIRTSNPVVLGAKFETVDFHDIYSELSKLNGTVKELDLNFSHMRKAKSLNLHYESIIELQLYIHLEMETEEPAEPS